MACERRTAQLTPVQISLVARLARFPEMIRGYGHIKDDNQESARQVRDAQRPCASGFIPVVSAQTNVTTVWPEIRKASLNRMARTTAVSLIVASIELRIVAAGRLPIRCP